ncbi:hypothetical protein Sjap_013623 [Stephania japonica]|uniref:Uncharacterized protein n=1 Tax=Stephania japonica TaxID=461633 RepID=A0AAP0J0S6_9MAGN
MYRIVMLIRSTEEHMDREVLFKGTNLFCQRNKKTAKLKMLRGVFKKKML